MLLVYGNMQCPDCVACCDWLDSQNITYQFCDICASIQYLKEFLSIRDREAVFNPVRKAGKIGIPCLVDDSGNIRLNWSM